MSRLQPAEGSSVDQSPRQHSLVFRHQRMQQGLLVKASNYASHACKPSASVSQFKGILVTRKDPIVWGDASNRYTSNNSSEINNNDFSNNLEHKADFASNGHHPVIMQDRTVTASQEHNTVRKYTRITPMSLKTINFADPLEIDEGEAECIRDENTMHSTVEVSTSSVSPPSSSNSNRYHSELSFNTTQQLRSGFFRSIKRQYSPILMPKQTEPVSSQCSTDSGIASRSSQVDEDEQDASQDYQMSKLARHKLEQLRRRGVKNVDVPTGLQWIRLELHEMREQDKSLFLQLIKLHTTIKDLRADMSGVEDFDSYDDLHSAASLWWPRRGHSFNTLPDFSSSDGAQIFRGCKSKTPLRRGFSLNYPPVSSPAKCSPDLSLREDALPSLRNNSECSTNIITGITATQ